MFRIYSNSDSFSMYFTRVWLIYAVSGNYFLNFIFAKEIESNFAFKKYIPPLRSMWRHLCFLLSKKFAIAVSGDKFILKNISTEKESEEADEFHDSQKCLRQSSSKNFSKKFFMDFVCFSNLSARFCVFVCAWFCVFLKRNYNLRDVWTHKVCF